MQINNPNVRTYLRTTGPCLFMLHVSRQKTLSFYRLAVTHKTCLEHNLHVHVHLGVKFRCLNLVIVLEEGGGGRGGDPPLPRIHTGPWSHIHVHVHTMYLIHVYMHTIQCTCTCMYVKFCICKCTSIRDKGLLSRNDDWECSDPSVYVLSTDDGDM